MVAAVDRSSGLNGETLFLRCHVKLYKNLKKIISKALHYLLCKYNDRQKMTSSLKKSVNAIYTKDEMHYKIQRIPPFIFMNNI